MMDFVKALLIVAGLAAGIVIPIVATAGSACLFHGHAASSGRG